MSFTLPNLPYAQDALAPHISAQTLEFHHEKHHATYVKNLNGLVEGTNLDGKTLVEVIQSVTGDASKIGVFNNAAQVWNHTFYWHSMKSGGGGKPSDALASKIAEAFGSYEDFVTQFKQAGATQFGSGWVWLVSEGGKLKIIKTANAETPLTQAGVTPLMTCDVWEHAYYLDFQNRRPDYLSTFFEHLVNWDFAAENLSKAA